MITKKQFFKAKDTIKEYKQQVNDELTSNYKCVICKEKILHPFSAFGEPPHIEVLEQNRGWWESGTVSRISFGYGSELDGKSYFIAVCDNCMEKAVEQKIAVDIQQLSIEKRKYFM